ncbi:MAG: CPBP family intramembrane metalloprotease [Candidatus Aminicenantes bacterium]|nr:CPBP family intramembrane metalloprotease [Candidatus Aminicenantes bacterium]
MTEITDGSRIRDRLGKLLNEKLMAAWSATALVLLIAGIVLWAGNKTGSIPLSLGGIAVAWALLRTQMWLQRLRWRDFGLKKPKSWIKTLGFAVVGTIGFHILINLILGPLVKRITGMPVDASQFDILRGNISALIIGLVIVWTLAAFGEEMVFRGYVMHTLARPFKNKIMGWVVAVTATSILFGLGHTYQGITGVILTGIIGLAYALVFFMSRRSLWVPILIHGLYDTSAFLIIFFNLDKGLL